MRRTHVFGTFLAMYFVACSTKKVPVDVEWSKIEEEYAGPYDKSGSIVLDLQDTYGQVFKAVVKKNTMLFRSDYQEFVFEDGKLYKTVTDTWANHPDHHCHYQGHVEGDPNSFVSLSTCDGFHGYISANGHQLVLSPPEKGAESHTIQSLSEHLAEHLERGFNGMEDWAKFNSNNNTVPNDAILKRHNVTSRKRRDLDDATKPKKYVEVLVVNDKLRYDSFDTQEKMGEHTAAVMQLVTSYYNDAASYDNDTFDYSINIVLVGMVTFTDTDPWSVSIDQHGEVSNKAILNHFNEWVVGQLAGKKILAHDNHILLTGYDFEAYCVGYAGVSSMCTISRSGSINMCKTESHNRCAAIVSHEMGHNFGMRHDSSGNSCPERGNIMNAVGSNSVFPTIFSSCSAIYINSFFTNTYSINGECLENEPSHRWGDPMCGDGFVTGGEEVCDCGSDDCGEDSCCDGSTCTFKDPNYECENTDACCKDCMLITAKEAYVCRAANNDCDIVETCDGVRAECPSDTWDYPGVSCSITQNNKTYVGTCYAGECNSAEYDCDVNINRDYWLPIAKGVTSTRLTKDCAVFNDECQNLFCTDGTSGKKDYNCVTNFRQDHNYFSVPDGTACWHKSDEQGTRTGICYDGQCHLGHVAAEYPVCGNGGIDYDEECDCGIDLDSSCDCQTCKLKSGKVCSANSSCCNADGTAFRSSSFVCREALGECDTPEYCTGINDRCPPDVGKSWETKCKNDVSTCYAKQCVQTKDDQCADKMGHGATYMKHTAADCTALVCCYQGKCTKSTQSTYQETGGLIRTYFGAADPGTYFPLVQNGTQRCVNEQNTLLLSDSSSCGSNQYLELSIGECVSCDVSCSSSGCTGPSNFDCNSCEYGEDSRGACAISSNQANYVNPNSPQQCVNGKFSANGYEPNCQQCTVCNNYKTPCTKTVDAVCEDPCIGIICSKPPNECHKSPGSCSEGMCIYALKHLHEPCSGGGTCDGNGSCVPPDSCTGITCTTPINECHKLPGFCSEGTCIYTPKAEGTLCSDAETEGSNPEGTCDGNGVCVPKGHHTMFVVDRNMGDKEL